MNIPKAPCGGAGRLLQAWQEATGNQKEHLRDVIGLIDGYELLGPNARKIARALIDRLVKGIEHGDFDKPHDWDKESSEEALDLAVYQAAKLLGLGQETGKGRPKLQTAREYTAPEGVRVSLDGRTSDGKPWVPPVGAQVRIVHRFFNAEPNVGEVLIVRNAHADKADLANMIAIDVPGHGWIACRVVPA